MYGKEKSFFIHIVDTDEEKDAYAFESWKNLIKKTWIQSRVVTSRLKCRLRKIYGEIND